MINYIRRHLGIKLFLSYILVILVGVAVIAITANFSVPQAFNQHMGMGLGAGQGMMQGAGQGKAIVSTLFNEFRVSFNQALILALLAAGVIAILVSLLLSRGVVAPVRAMTNASQRIADGNYAERILSAGSDELGQLGRSFNQMAEKLEQVESMRRQLIGDISHELRTPLTAIKGSMEGLMDGVLPATSDTYQQIHQEAERLARLVDDLQELSRVEARAYPLNMCPVEVATLVQTILKRLASQAREKNIELLADLPADLPPVQADPDRIIQVLTNLVGNAVQYTPAGGRVDVSVRRAGDEVRFNVSDTGIGIPAEHLLNLFHRFYRVDMSRTRQTGGGSGIGLTISKYLVEAQNGRIWVESEGDGKGSTFSFTLKVAM